MGKEIAIMGVGAWGKNHMRNLHEMGVLHTVMDRSRERLDLLRKEIPDVHCTTDEADVLGHPDIRAVVVSAPAAHHFEITKKLLASGKDVLVEKPLALHVEEGEILVELAQKMDRVLMVGHILQYHPAVSKLRDVIGRDELGPIRYIYSNRLNIGKLRSEENVLWSFAPHDISLILMLMNGEDPLVISAYGGAFVNPRVYDTTLTFFRFRSGVRGHVFVSWLHPFKEQKLVVVGAEKMAVFDDISREKLFIYPHRIKIEEGRIPVAQKADYYTIPVETREPLREELLHFIQCVERRESPRTDAREGLRVLKFLARAEKSLQNGGKRSEGDGDPS